MSTTREQVADLISQGKTHRDIAKTLGVSRGTVSDYARSLRAAPAFDAPAGFAAKAVSTLHDADGNVRLQWVKSGTKERTAEEWAAHVKDALASTAPLKAIPKPKKGDARLLTVYPIGDQHHGMHAWGKESGADYDIKISTQLLTSAVAHLVNISPASDQALIVNVGDFFHVDNKRAQTEKSGNPLDVDTRYGHMIRTGVALLRTCIETALTKHQHVKVINACGNHDDIGALWLSLALGLFYEKNPRVTIEQSPAKFAYHRFGSVLIGVTHGDSLKLDDLGEIMSVDCPQDWGAAPNRYWLTGHIHHRKSIELRGCMVESFRTLASRDAWANGAGYRAGRDMTSVVFHQDHGEIARHRFDVSMMVE